MAGRVRSLRFVLTGDDKTASKAVDKFGGKVDGLGKKLGGFASLGGAALGAGAVAFGTSSVKAFMEAEEAQKRLSDSYKKFPKLADVSLDSIKGLNSSLATKTKYDDDAIASGESVLAGFGLTGKQLKDLTPLLLDYATVTGKDLPEAARDLGKASMGQGKALKGIGLNLKDLKDPAKNMTQLMDGLSKKVGGFAQKDAQTAAGQVTILKNRFGELKESVGEQLLPVLTGFVGWLNDKGVPALQGFADEFRNGKGAGGELKATLGEIKSAFETSAAVANKTIVPVIKWFAEHPDALKGVATGMAAYATATKFAAIYSALIKPIPPSAPGLPGGGGTTVLPGGGGGKPGKGGKIGKIGGAGSSLLGGPVGVGITVGSVAGYVDPKLPGKLGSDSYLGVKPGHGPTNPKDWYLGFDGKYHKKSDPRFMPQKPKPLAAPERWENFHGASGVRPQIVLHSTISLNATKVGKTTTTVQRKSVRNGAKPAFGL